MHVSEWAHRKVRKGFIKEKLWKCQQGETKPRESNENTILSFFFTVLQISNKFNYIICW